MSDFRLSRVAGEIDESGLGMNGTIRWMAPELLRGEPEAAVCPTLPSDVWAFGCTFYEVRELLLVLQSIQNWYCDRYC